MSNHKDCFIEVFQINNSVFIFIFIAYIFDTFGMVRFISGLGLFAQLFLIPLKIMLYAGFLGVIVEIVSKEEVVVRFERFKANVKEFWLLYLLISLIPLMLYVISLIILPAKIKPNLAVLMLQMEPIVSFLFIFIVVYKKYIRPLNLKSRGLRIANEEVFTIMLLYFVHSIVYYLPKLIIQSNIDFPRLITFFSKYLFILICVYFTKILINKYPEIYEQFIKRKEIYLINPISGCVMPALISLSFRSYPSWFVVIKAYTKKDYYFREFNRVLWRQRYYQPNKLVAITCYSNNSYEAYKIAKEFKKQGSKVIMGGPHVMHLSKEALEYCDSVVIGEAEGVWHEIINDYENNSLKPVYESNYIDEYSIEVQQELLNSPLPVIRDFLETTRGCKFKCHFCAVGALSKRALRKKPIVQIIELVKIVRNKYRNVIFLDNNIYSDPVHAKDLFRALKPLNIRWQTQCSIDIAKDDEALLLAKESGCDGLLIGYEISPDSEEKNRGGKMAIVDQYLELTNKIKKAGIKIKAHFIFGFEKDSLKSLLLLWRSCFRLFPSDTVVSLLTPFPGSPIFYDLVKQDRITNMNWRRYNINDLVFEHKYMNNFFLNAFFPVIRYFFLFSTSLDGVIIFFLVAVCVIISW